MNKKRCRNITRNLINNGSIKKEPCLLCGDEIVECHHNNYSDPHDITWLCKPHHYKIHGKKVKGKRKGVEQITISIPDDVKKQMDEYRKKKYPHLKRVSRMMLQIVMDKIYEEQS